MGMVTPLAVLRGTFVSLFSATMGSASGMMIGAPLFVGSEGIKLSGPVYELVSSLLVFMPFTLFGSLAVLLPTYYAARDRTRSLKQVYSAVAISGPLGALLIIFLIVLGIGGIAAPGRIPFSLFGWGALCGASTAFWWIAAHYLTRNRRSV